MKKKSFRGFIFFVLQNFMCRKICWLLGEIYNLVDYIIGFFNSQNPTIINIRYALITNLFKNLKHNICKKNF